MAQAVPSTQVNGFAPMTLDQDVQDAFFEQLLKLRDAVLSDSHPRFKLPADVKHRLQAAKASPSTPVLDNLQQHPSSIDDAQSRSQHGGSLSNGARNAISFDSNKVAHASQVSAPKIHPSGIDPVLLTKSDDLIRAEIHLKRQRIEKQLRDSVDQRRQSTRRDADSESTTLLDLPEILQKAWEVVKPVSGLSPATNPQTAASDSFDENSYYSSQVNDWSSEASAHSRRNEATAAPPAVIPTQSGAAKPSATDPASSAPLSKQRPSENERRLDSQNYQTCSPMYQVPQGGSFYANDTETAYDAEREDSEEYSPPAAEAFSGADGADADAMDLDDDSSEFVPEEPTLPPSQVSINTAHLMHVAAPQPARISPLAVSRVPGLDQHAGRRVEPGRFLSPRTQVSQIAPSRLNERIASEESTTSPRNSGQQSPTNPSTKKQRTRQRKRKREAEAAEKTRKKPQERAIAKSPEPYIKSEPVSPPPFANMSELQPGKSRSLNQLHPDVEIVSPREFQPRRRQPYYQQAPRPQSLRYASPASPAVVQITSPGGYARPKRDDQDLRRVASLHTAQRQRSPAHSPVAPYRTVSQPHLDQPTPPSARYRAESGIRPSQYGRSERSMSPPQLRMARDPYMQRVESPGLMPPPPPPPRRIVVDQYGNKYVAAEETPAPMPPPPPAHGPRMSVAPQIPHEVEVAYERAPSRASVAYAPQPQHMVHDDGRMPPPPPSMRRVVVQPEAETLDYRAYRQREYSRHPEPQYYREEPVYMRDGLPGHAPAQTFAAYPADHGAPAGHGRAYSVRPDAETIRYVSRAPSVMPQPEYVRMPESAGPAQGIRAVSVAPGSDYGRMAEPRYTYQYPQAYPMAPPAGRGYMEDDSPRATAPPPPRQEVYVDQYGREVRRVPVYQ